MSEKREVQQLVLIIDQAYDHSSWHGTNLRGSIRRVSAAQAAWRPAPARHNIWEVVVHAAYWKYAAWRRLTGAVRGSFPLEGSNWFQRPQERTQKAWRSDVALLDRMHRSLREAVASLPARELHRTPRGSKVSNFALLSGIAAHDLYHAGQIQLLKKLSQGRGAARGVGATLIKGRGSHPTAWRYALSRSRRLKAAAERPERVLGPRE